MTSGSEGRLCGTDGCSRPIGVAGLPTGLCRRCRDASRALAPVPDDGGAFDGLNQNSRTVAFLNGHLGLEALDAEELALGVLRNEDGTLPLDSPYISSTVKDRMKAHLLGQAATRLRMSLDVAVETMCDIMTDPNSGPTSRLRAAVYIFERIAGRTVDPETGREVKPWEEILEKVSRRPRSI